MPSPSSRDIATGLLGQVDHLPSAQSKKKALVLLAMFAAVIADEARLRGGKKSVWAEHFGEVLDGYFERLVGNEQRAADEAYRHEALHEDGDEYVLCFDWAERAEEMEQAEQKAGEARKEEQA